MKWLALGCFAGAGALLLVAWDLVRSHRAIMRANAEAERDHAFLRRQFDDLEALANRAPRVDQGEQ